MTSTQERAPTRTRSAAFAIVLIGALSGLALALQGIGRVSSELESAAVIACGVLAAALIGARDRGRSPTSAPSRRLTP